MPNQLSTQLVLLKERNRELQKKLADVDIELTQINNQLRTLQNTNQSLKTQNDDLRNKKVTANSEKVRQKDISDALKLKHKEYIDIFAKLRALNLIWRA